MKHMNSAAAGWCLRWYSFEMSTSSASVVNRSFLSRGSFLWERKPRLMPNQSNFKGSCFGLSLGRSLGPKLRPNQASLDLWISQLLFRAKSPEIGSFSRNFSLVMLLQALMAQVAPLQARLFETRQLQFQKLLSY